MFAGEHITRQTCSLPAPPRRSWQGGMKTLAQHAKHALPVEEIRRGASGMGTRRSSISWIHLKMIGDQYLVGGLVAIFSFPIFIGNLIIPIDELIFFRGVAEPPTSYPKVGV